MKNIARVRGMSLRHVSAPHCISSHKHQSMATYKTKQSYKCHPQWHFRKDWRTAWWMNYTVNKSRAVKDRHKLASHPLASTATITSNISIAIYKPGVQIQPCPISPVIFSSLSNSHVPYSSVLPSRKADLKPNKPKISPINDPHSVYWGYTIRPTDVSESPQKIPHWDVYPGTKIAMGPC